MPFFIRIDCHLCCKHIGLTAHCLNPTQWLSSHRAVQKVHTTRRSPLSQWNQMWNHQEKRKTQMTKNQSLMNTSFRHQSPRRQYRDQGYISQKIFMVVQRFRLWWNYFIITTPSVILKGTLKEETRQEEPFSTSPGPSNKLCISIVSIDMEILLFSILV